MNLKSNRTVFKIREKRTYKRKKKNNKYKLKYFYVYI